MANDLAAFGRRMQQIANGIDTAVDLTAKDGARAALIEVIKETPVDVGTARSNWAVGLGASPITTRRPAFMPYRSRWASPAGAGGSKGESANAAAAFALGAAKIAARQPHVDIYIDNQIPYIGRLNAGYSKQSGPGFVTRAVALAASQLVRRAVYHLRREIG